MFNRPRCRDWTPLVTQQLRLRNLIQISGHNINCEPKSSIYYTLHQTSMSAPFFTSEKLDSPKSAIWPEINCPSIVKSTAHSVCIRVWQRTITDNKRKSRESSSDSNQVLNNDEEYGQFAISNGESICDASDTTEDKVLFLWGVYFSGLVPISKRTDVKLNENSLVFHIHGGFFTAAECLMPESVISQMEYIGLVAKRPLRDSNGDGEKTSTSVTATNERCDQIVLSRQCIVNLHSSPLDLIQFSESPPTTSPTPLAHDSNLLKVRFVEMNFYKSEIRTSYNVERLLLLQDQQRRIRNRTENSRAIMDKICMKSAFCLNLELIANKAMLYRPRGNPSMGRTLNRLLFQQIEQMKPEDLLKAQEIRRKIEMAKFRGRLLVQERNQAQANIRQLERKLGQISDANIEKESWLMENYRALGREKETTSEMVNNSMKQRDELVKIYESLHLRRQQLVRELKEIYCIQRNDQGVLTINGAALPSAKSFIEYTSASNISVALGYAAHLTLMCSVILNFPLRNPIIYKGSASRIRDDVKVMAEHEREYPLYCRNCPPPASMQYAIYLLNQNIAQIKVMVGMNREGLRATLNNLLQLLNGPLMMALPYIRPSLNCQNIIGCNTTNASSPADSTADLKGLIHGNPPHSDINDDDTDKRICRSVGSYSVAPIVSLKKGGHYGSDPMLSTSTLHNMLRTFNDNGNF